VINLSWPVRVSLHTENKLLMLLGFVGFLGHDISGVVCG